MAQIVLDGLSPAIFQEIERRARRAGRSVQAEASRLLEDALARDTASVEHDEDRAAGIGERFDALLGRWIQDTGPSSSLRDIVSHAAYQEIIAMGREAVPLILRDLERQPRHWNPALKAITGAAPVPKEHAGRLELIAQDWLSWAKANGYVW